MSKGMTKYAACRRAFDLWHDKGPTFATIRRKSVVDRFEVGYSHGGRIVLGAGPTWEIAFDRALGTAT